MAVVCRKARQQHRGRHVADDLAGRGADEERRHRDDGREQVADRRDTREIARKDKERAKGQQQAVVDAQKALGLEYRQRDGDDNQPDVVREHAKDNHHRQREQHEVDDHSPHGRRGFGVSFEAYRLGLDDKASAGDEHERDRERDRHDCKEFARIDLKKRIQVQILGVAERRQHSAEIGGDVLHDKDECGIFCLAARRQHKPAQRQKCDQRHIVRHDHRAEVGDEHQRERDAAHIAERGDDPGRQPLEKAAAFERAYDRERAKEARQRVEVEIVGIAAVGRHEKAGDRRRDQCDDQHDAAFEYALDDVPLGRLCGVPLLLFHIPRIFIYLCARVCKRLGTVFNIKLTFLC